MAQLQNDEAVLTISEAVEICRSRGFEGSDKTISARLYHHIRRGYLNADNQNPKRNKPNTGYTLKHQDLMTWLDGFDYQDGKVMPLSGRHQNHDRIYPLGLRMTTLTVPQKYKNQIREYAIAIAHAGENE